MDYYLEQRKDGFGVGTVCHQCKVLAIPLASVIIEDAMEEHEAKGRFDLVQDYRELAQTLARETAGNSLAG